MTLMTNDPNGMEWLMSRRGLGYLEFACAKGITILASCYLAYKIIKLDWSGKYRNLYHVHQLCSLMGTICFFLFHTLHFADQVCTLMCIPMQYCFVVFLTLVIIELVQVERCRCQKNTTISCSLGWFLPAIPVVLALYLHRETCWLNLGPDFAFATMLPMIVITSTACYLAESSHEPNFQCISKHGHFVILTNAWLMYFSALMTMNHQSTLIYAICYACSCFSLGLCLTTSQLKEPPQLVTISSSIAEQTEKKDRIQREI